MKGLMMNRLSLRLGSLGFVLMFACLLAVGCGSEDGTSGSSGSAGLLPDGLFLDSAPDGVKTIADLKKSAKEGDEVVVRVVVGGTQSPPLVEGRASAQIIDASLDNHCLSDDDHCEKPWDYCCTAKEDKFPQMATLQVVDADGRVLATGLDSKMSAGATLVIKGLVGKRANDESLPINATGIYIEKATLR